MLKFEWPLIVPENEDVKRLAKATFDIDEYVVDIAKKDGLPPGLKPIEGGVSVHLACHARAQNMGPKAAEMLKLVPGTPVDVIERCSGHGGTFGVLKPTHEVAMKVGQAGGAHGELSGACACRVRLSVGGKAPEAGDARARRRRRRRLREIAHPIELMARAYGLVE